MTEPMEKKSRSQLKRESTALQDMGKKLAALPAPVLDRIDMPGNLRSALTDLGAMTKNEARRRQMQLVGKLMREADIAPIAEALDALASNKALADAKFHRAESWRDRLLNGEDSVIEEVMSEFPDADRQHLWQLTRNARAERAKGKPPKNFRALFRALKVLEE